MDENCLEEANERCSSFGGRSQETAGDVEGFPECNVYIFNRGKGMKKSVNGISQPENGIQRIEHGVSLTFDIHCE